jgi:hypothetical protein
MKNQAQIYETLEFLQGNLCVNHHQINHGQLHQSHQKLSERNDPVDQLNNNNYTDSKTRDRDDPDQMG